MFVSRTPSTDSDIKVEVWLPAAGWNGKFQAVGNGGWAGTISYPALAQAVAAGYAAASTDTGHVGNSAAFAIGMRTTCRPCRPAACTFSRTPPMAPTCPTSSCRDLAAAKRASLQNKRASEFAGPFFLR